MTLTNFVLEAGFSPNTSSTVYANKTLLILENGQTLTYNDINIKSAQLAEYLINVCKVKKGDCVICRTSKLNSVSLYLAVLRIGAIYVPLNPQYTATETEHFLTTVEPQAFVTCNKIIDISLKHLVKNENIIDETALVDEALKLRGILEIEKVEDNDTAVILFTSGTTGKTKGAATSHGALCRNASLLVSTWKFSSEDILLHALPFYHVHGMLVAFHCTIFSKSSTIFLNKYVATDVANWMPKATVFMGVPTFYSFSRLLELDNFTKETTSNIRLFVCGSAPLTEQLFENFKKRTGGRTILQRFGMTEANAITSSPYPEEERSYSNVGKPFPGVEIKISSNNSILVRSKNIFSGYWKEPEKTKKEFTDDGFFNTGDVGEINDEGFLILNGREKDVIISGGLNVYPREIEDLVDSVDEIKESAIFGSPHSDFGEAVVAACIFNDDVPLANESEVINKLIDLCQKKLASYKRPKRWLILDELPRNFLGKVQKNVLRERFKTLFN